MKFAPFVVLTLIFGGLVGWFAPGGADTPAPGQQAMAELAVANPAGGERVLTRAGDGHFYADVSIGGGTVLMLVDTGASVVALTGTDAAMMGVDWNESDVRPVARGASGAVSGVPVMLDNVQIGDVEVRHVQAIVVPEGLPISLLGQSFLSRVGHVEMNGDEMVLGR